MVGSDEVMRGLAGTPNFHHDLVTLFQIETRDILRAQADCQFIADF